MSKQAGNVTQDDFGKQNKQQVPEAEVARILPGAQPRRAARDEHRLGTAPAPSCPFAFPFPSQQGAFSFKKKKIKRLSHHFTEQEKNRLRPFSAVVTENTENQKKRYLFGQRTFLQPLPGHFGPGSAQRHRKRRKKRKVGGKERVNNCQTSLCSGSAQPPTTPSWRVLTLVIFILPGLHKLLQNLCVS